MLSGSSPSFPKFSCPAASLRLLTISFSSTKGNSVTKSPFATSFSVVTRGHREQLRRAKGAPRRYRMMLMHEEWLFVIVTVSPFHGRVLGIHRMVSLAVHPSNSNEFEGGNDMQRSSWIESHS
ncbi:hypothetical protein BDR05DRAFT_963504, partial [Suillus weaverae]